MPAPKIKEQTAWENRWEQPTREQLYGLIDEGKRKFWDALRENVLAFDGVEEDVVWHGLAWKWVTRYTHPAAATEGEPDGVIAYVVTLPDQAQFCVPLSTDEILSMPVRRLNRYIRDQLRSAKCAVEMHWGHWEPTAMTEVEYLTDLIKRKYKFLTAEQ